jgi:hypothetical protein
VGKPDGNRHLEALGIYRRTTSILFLKKENGEWTGLIWLRIGTDGGSV